MTPTELLLWALGALAAGIIGLIVYIWQDTQTKTATALATLSSVVAKLDDTLDSLKETFFGRVNKLDMTLAKHISQCETRCASCPHANPSVEHPVVHLHRRTDD